MPQAMKEQGRLSLYDRLNDELARVAWRAASFDALLGSYLTTLRRVLQIDRAALFTTSLDGNFLQVVAAEGVAADVLPRRARMRVGDYNTGRAQETGQPQIISNVNGLAPSQDMMAEGARSLMSIPVQRYGQTLGVLTVAMVREGFSKEEAGLLMVAMAPLAFALDALRRRGLAKRRAREYERLLNLLPVGIVLFDPQRQVIFASSLALSLLGAEHPEFFIPARPGDSEFPRPDRPLTLGDTVRSPWRGALDNMARQVLEYGLACEDTLRGPAESSTRDSGKGAALDWQLMRIGCWMAPRSMGIAPDATNPTTDMDEGGILVVRDLSDDSSFAGREGSMGRKANRGGLPRQLGGHEQSLGNERTAGLFSMLSHELRTPLTSMRGAVFLMNNAADDEPLSKHRHLVSIVDKNSQRLTDIISDLVDLAQIESGELPFEPSRQDLRDVIIRSWDMLKASVEAKSVSLVLEPDNEAGGPFVMIDRLLTLRVMRHLLDNAVKFSPAGGTVRVSFGDVDGGKLPIRVQDEGAGIPPEFMAQLFRKFAQSDPIMTRRAGGNGLGLYLVRVLSTHQGGDVELLTTSPRGTTFLLRLPVSA